MVAIRSVVALLAALLILGPAATARPMAVSGVATGDLAYVDPNLLTQVAAKPSPAILAWDDQTTTRAEVGSYLQQTGIQHHVFSALSMAIGCATRASDVVALAGAPGAISVWGDEQMTPTLDRSVPTAFRGDPGVVWSGLGITGEGVGIAVLDTGIDGTHPDVEFGRRIVLNARVVVSHLEIMGPGNDSCYPDSFQEDIPDSETVSGHGTHMASIAAGDGTASAGRLKGMAPEADLIGLNIAEQATPEVDSDVDVSLIRFIAAANYVISRALEGGPTIAKVALLGWTSTGLFDPWHPHYLSVRDLYDFGISVVMPVGNGGPGASSCDSADTCHFNRLAVGQYPIAVGATPKDFGGQLEDYSSRGDPTQREARGQWVSYEPTLVAPGSYVVAARRAGLAAFAPPLPTRYPLGAAGAGVNNDLTNPQYQALTGTSVAAAHVAGTIALMQQAAVEAKGCFLHPGQVKSILEGTATPIGGYQRWEVGSGAVNATAAVFAARQVAAFRSADPWVCPPPGTPAAAAP